MGDGLVLGFRHNAAETYWANYAGSWPSDYINFVQESAGGGNNVGVNGFTLTNPLKVPDDVYELNSSNYLEISRLSNGETEINFYDSTYALLHTTKITDIINYSNYDLIFTLYWNRYRETFLGMVVEQGTNLTPQSANEIMLLTECIRLFVT